MELVENEDYYFEDGKLVFTSKYLKDRRYCCESGCRHCPYKQPFFLERKNLVSKKEL
ncbi:MAG TPA: DUF5522 domain-containing protein [Candidatus Nanoarchaeia archaeon]|nr:DUF5522 domain-containing protein [Candidatus Nanoarchaeia archaeon]